MLSITGTEALKPRICIATSSGRAYYRISNLLKKIGMPFAEVVVPKCTDEVFAPSNASMRNYGIVITTRKERLQFQDANIVCEEDLGEDAGLAKQKLIALLYPLHSSDLFVIGIDPGERTGLAAFLNHREIESAVYTSLDATLARVSSLIDNAPDIRKIVKIGSGNPNVALKIAKMIDVKYKRAIEINLVNESGTSVLRRKGKLVKGTRDQRAARLIAFRSGMRYDPLKSFSQY